jgi:MATE family multidrug resistance protein
MSDPISPSVENTGKRPPGPVREVLALSLPASLGMLSPTITRFVDGIMIGGLGSESGPPSLAAQTVAGIMAFAPESFAMGILTVVNTFVAQNLGAGNKSRCGEYAWSGLLLALLCAAAIAPLAMAAGPIFRVLGHEPALAAMESMYFRYMVLAVLVTLPARVLESFFFGIHRPTVVFVCALTANAVNVAAGWVLIYGKLGLPTLGLRGAAYASILSWVLQLAMLLGFFLSRPIREGFGAARPRRMHWGQMRDILKVGWPAGLQFGNDVLTWSVFIGWLVGYFGEVHLAASSAAMRYMPLSFMPAVGIGIAATALVGRYIGQGRHDLARQRTHVALAVAMTYMGLCAVAFFIFRYPLVEAFIRSEASTTPAVAAQAAEIVRIGGQIMILAAIFQLFDALGIVYIGALRGAGDTLFPMIATFALSWGMTVGLAAAFIWLAPGLMSLGPWIAASGYVVALGIIVAVRFERGRWMRIDLLHNRDAPLA